MKDFNLLDGLTCMVVNGDIASRSRLREVIKTCIYKSEMHLFQSCRDAVAHLELDEVLDVIFISSNFGTDVIKSFVQDLTSKIRSKTTFVIVTIDKQNSKTATQVTNLYLDGVAGFIAEPYSPTELTQLLTALKARQSEINDDAKQRKDDDVSRELSRLFGRTPIEWLKIQKDYDAFKATEQASAAASTR